MHMHDKSIGYRDSLVPKAVLALVTAVVDELVHVGSTWTENIDLCAVDEPNAIVQCPTSLRDSFCVQFSVLL